MRPLETQAPDAPQRRPGAKQPGPGPSKLRYRVSRAWAKPAVRATVTVYLPLALLGLAGWRLAADDGIRMAVEARVAAAAERLAARPEFAVSGLEVTGASARLRTAVEETVGLIPGISSLKLDLDHIRASVEALGPVAGASVRLDPGGLMKIQVTERVARALWRDGEGRLALIDGEGVIIGRAARRADRPRLPLLLGDGAPARVGEALALLSAAPDLVERIRALVLVGERRWNIALAGGVVVMLPEKGAVPALARMMEVHRTEELLDRDLAAVDMRIGGRPTLRLRPRALETYRAHGADEGEGT